MVLAKGRREPSARPRSLRNTGDAEGESASGQSFEEKGRLKASRFGGRESWQ